MYSSNRCIDGSSGPAVYCVGHGVQEVNDAIKQQLDKIAMVTGTCLLVIR